MALFRRRRRRRREHRERSLAWQLFYGFLALALVAGLGALTWYATRLPDVTLSSVTVSGGETIPHEEVRRVVESELEGSYFFLVPKRFAYLYPRERILEQLSYIPRLHDPHVERVSRNELAVSFSEYTPFALWCPSEQAGTSADEFVSCIFLSEEGYAFATAPALRGSAFMRFVTEGRAPVVGEHVMENDILSSTLTLLAVLDSELSFRVNVVAMSEDGDLELRLTGGSTLIVSPTMSAQDTFENLKSILESKEFDHLTPGNFNYIDLRFGNKVFVNEEFPEERATSTATSSEDAFEIEFE